MNCRSLKNSSKCFIDELVPFKWFLNFCSLSLFALRLNPMFSHYLVQRFAISINQLRIDPLKMSMTMHTQKTECIYDVFSVMQWSGRVLNWFFFTLVHSILAIFRCQQSYDILQNVFLSLSHSPNCELTTATRKKRNLNERK